MKRDKLPILKVTCVICVVTFIGSNLLLHKDLFEAQSGVSFDADKITPQLRDDVIPKVEVPLGFLTDDIKLHRRLLGRVSHTNVSQSYHDRSSVNIQIRELSQMLVETSKCENIKFNVTKGNFIGSGWTKAVYTGQVKGQQVAVKTVDEDGFESRNCNVNLPKETSTCFQESASKILREISILQKIKHPNIVQLVAHCTEVTASHVPTRVLLATELGSPVDIIKLLQLSWEDRLRISYGLIKLMYFLAHSPFGSIVLNDFRREQFILVAGDIKLTDMDDIGFQERSCHTNKDCSVTFSSSNVTISSRCHRSQCQNLNEKLNIYNTGRHFTTFILPHGCPQKLKPKVTSIVHGISNVTLNSGELLAKVEKLLLQYSNGHYLQGNRGNTSSAYQEFLYSDLPGQFDYGCRYSISTVCSLSVFDKQEAAEMCDKDTSCAGFVWSSQLTWTGRTLAIFKNNFGAPSYNKDTILYIKPEFVK